ncbi:MAG: hypothetical protein JKY42_11570 [Flavobacteriales bacterium]|nr:hypothetical protein [Flavobacteriales bacterium]
MKKLLSGLFGVGMPDFNAIIEAAYRAALEGFLLYAIIGVLLAVIILLIINLRKSFQPESNLFKFFNYINFIYLPLLFVFVFGSFGSWNSSKKYAIGEIHEGVLPSVKMIFPAFQIYLSMNDEKLKSEKADLKAAVLRFSTIISITTTSDSWLEKQKIAVAKKEIPLMLYRGIDAVVQTEIEKRGNPTGDELAVAMNMSFFRPTSKFWSSTEEKLIEGTKNYFNTKLSKLSIYYAIASLFLLLQLLVLTFKTKR